MHCRVHYLLDFDLKIRSGHSFPKFPKTGHSGLVFKNNINFHPSRLDINDLDRLPFEMDTAYEPNEWGNNLKIALIQKREEFSDSPLPRMYDTELIRYDNSHSEVVTKFKVIKNTYCNLPYSRVQKHVQRWRAV